MLLTFICLINFLSIAAAELLLLLLPFFQLLLLFVWLQLPSCRSGTVKKKEEKHEETLQNCWQILNLQHIRLICHSERWELSRVSNKRFLFTNICIFSGEQGAVAYLFDIFFAEFPKSGVDRQMKGLVRPEYQVLHRCCANSETLILSVVWKYISPENWLNEGRKLLNLKSRAY